MSGPVFGPEPAGLTLTTPPQASSNDVRCSQCRDQPLTYGNQIHSQVTSDRNRAARFSVQVDESALMPKVNFVNEKLTVDVKEGEDLRTVARRNGVQIYSGPHKIFNCQGFGQCCSCNVIIRNGSENVSGKGVLERLWKWLNPLLGLKMLSNPEKDVRLACCTRVRGDVEVETHPPINWHGDKFWG